MTIAFTNLFIAVTIGEMKILQDKSKSLAFKKTVDAIEEGQYFLNLFCSRKIMLKAVVDSLPDTANSDGIENLAYSCSTE